MTLYPLLQAVTDTTTAHQLAQLVRVLAEQNQHAVTHDATPFFTNDATGWLKLAGFVTAVVAGVGAIVLKLLFHGTTQKVDRMQEQLDGFGKRVNEEAAERNTCTANVTSLQRELVEHKAEVRALSTSMSEVKATQAAMLSTSAEQQRDIMQAIMASGAATTELITTVRLEVAALKERANFSSGLEEIAAILRGRDRNQRENDARTPRG